MSTNPTGWWLRLAIPTLAPFMGLILTTGCDDATAQRRISLDPKYLATEWAGFDGYRTFWWLRLDQSGSGIGAYARSNKAATIFKIVRWQENDYSFNASVEPIDLDPDMPQKLLGKAAHFKLELAASGSNWTVHMLLDPITDREDALKRVRHRLETYESKR